MCTMMSTLKLFFILCALFFTSNAVTTIFDTWFDDFVYDGVGVNGWNDNSIIDGTHRKYHGWFTKNGGIPVTLYRGFQCNESSYIQLSFIAYYGCNIEGNEALIIFFNDRRTHGIIYSDLEQNNHVYHVNESMIPLCDADASESIGFRGSNVTRIISANPVRKLRTFVIKFEFQLSAGLNNEFQGVSDIQIQCIAAQSLSRLFIAFMVIFWQSYLFKSLFIYIQLHWNQQSILSIRWIQPIFQHLYPAWNQQQIN